MSLYHFFAPTYSVTMLLDVCLKMVVHERIVGELVRAHPDWAILSPM